MLLEPIPLIRLSLNTVYRQVQTKVLFLFFNQVAVNGMDLFIFTVTKYSIFRNKRLSFFFIV